MERRNLGNRMNGTKIYPIKLCDTCSTKRSVFERELNNLLLAFEMRINGDIISDDFYKHYKYFMSTWDFLNEQNKEIDT
jgi:hypothetical protein